MAKLELTQTERPKIDEEFEEVTEGEEQTSKEKLKTKWAALEALVGSEKRIKLVAQDIWLNCRFFIRGERPFDLDGLLLSIVEHLRKSFTEHLGGILMTR